MKLIVNGENHCHNGKGILSELLEELNMQNKRIAVVVNEEIVPKSKQKDFKLKEGDKIDFIMLASGG